MCSIYKNSCYISSLLYTIHSACSLRANRHDVCAETLIVYQTWSLSVLWFAFGWVCETGSTRGAECSSSQGKDGRTDVQWSRIWQLWKVVRPMKGMSLIREVGNDHLTTSVPRIWCLVCWETKSSSLWLLIWEVWVRGGEEWDVEWLYENAAKVLVVFVE